MPWRLNNVFVGDESIQGPGESKDLEPSILNVPSGPNIRFFADESSQAPGELRYLVPFGLNVPRGSNNDCFC